MAGAPSPEEEQQLPVPATVVIMPSVKVTNWAGGPDLREGRPANEIYVAGSTELSGLAVNAAGNLYFADVANSRVRRIGPDGIVTTVAGSTPFRFKGDGGPAFEAVMNAPIAVAASPDASVHVIERDNCRVRSIAPDGIIPPSQGMAYASLGSIRAPAASPRSLQRWAGRATALATDSHGNVYLAEGSRIRFITADGQIKNVVNRNGFPGAFGDITGSAAEARISGPIFGLYVDGDDNIYFGYI